MFIILRAFLSSLFFLCLHAWNYLFLFDCSSQSVKHIYNLHILISRFFQGTIHPAIRLTANIHKHICVSYLCYILCSWLITVKIHPLIEQHSKLKLVGITAYNIADPVILRKSRTYNAVRRSICRIFRHTAPFLIRICCRH